jgi:glycosyltransferase involved in cell wall biosynthesis
MTLIMPTKDRAETLKFTLKEILQCDGVSDVQFIFCNDGSTDQTQQVLEIFKSNNPNLDIIIFNDGHRGVSYQRNRAAEIARGDILLFAADDIRPVNSQWIQAHIELHEHQK